MQNQRGDPSIHFRHCRIDDKQNIASHALQYEHLNASDEGSAQDARSGAHPSLNDRALSESLKLLFNLIQHYPQRVDDFTSTVPDILLILSRIPLEEKPIQPPVNYLINALLNLDIPGKPSMNDSSIESTALFPFPDAACHTQRLVDILERASRGGNEEELESTLVPLVTLLRRINGMAPPEAQLCLRKRLLPPSRERDRPLGKSDTFSSRLLRLSTSPVAPNLKEGISSLLFELSDNDPATFIRNVGYGHAAGFLMTHNISLPESVINDVNANGVTSVDGLEVNPITGQRLDREAKDLGPDMTDEEKEREAEKLFVLFERLKATGVVNAINPVEQAARQGTLEEVE